ncbi:hypothetical protein AAMO2058_001602900 [Amorphochlora amoebiformis]
MQETRRVYRVETNIPPPRDLASRLASKERSIRSVRAQRLRFSECFIYAIHQYRILEYLHTSRYDFLSHFPAGVLGHILSYTFPPESFQPITDQMDKNYREKVKRNPTFIMNEENKGEVWFAGKSKPLDDGFTVCIRKRPVLAFETKAGEYDCVTCSGRSIVCHDGKVALEGMQGGSLEMVHRVFGFDQIFSEKQDNKSVFIQAVVPLLNHVLEKKCNASFLCHGQTGTGKTFTITGMQELVARQLFSGEGKERIQVEFFELFGKECRDLLADRKTVHLRSDGNNRVHARGATQAVARCTEELIAILAKGNATRAIESTERNNNSSRSHSILRLSIRSANGASFTLVDLAGSERNYETWFHTAEQHKKFVGINQSLMALKQCFRAYRTKIKSSKDSKASQAFIPFHASALTHLLRECFLDPTHKTALVATISPTSTDVEHTRETLEHVSFMMGNRRKPELSFRVDVADVKKDRLDQAIPMRLWDSRKLEEWLLDKVAKTEGDRKDITVGGLTGKEIKGMGKTALRFRLCNGNAELGTRVFAAVRKELKRLRSIDGKNRMVKSRR